MSVFEFLKRGRELKNLLLQASKMAARLNNEADGRLGRLALLIAQAAEEAEMCFDSRTC